MQAARATSSLRLDTVALLNLGTAVGYLKAKPQSSKTQGCCDFSISCSIHLLTALPSKMNALSYLLTGEVHTVKTCLIVKYTL